MKQTYFVSEFHMDWLKEYIEKINKRAVKLGQKQITYKTIAEEFKVVKVKVEQDRELVENEVVTKVYTVEIEAEPVGVEGYRFVASIEHGYESGNIVHSVDDVQVPAHYHTVDGVCEHCNTNRRRKITVLLMNDENKLIQIGRSCLKDYIGYDVEAQLKYMDLLDELVREIGEQWSGITGSSYVPYIELAKYLTFVEQEINEHGWASKSSVERIEQSTAYQAELRMNNWDSKHPDEEVTPSEYVLNALEWIRTTEDTSRDYMANLQIMCKGEYIRVKDMGYVASLLSTYAKHLEYQKKKELEAKGKANSQHVGIVGKREVFELTYVRHNSFETNFGMMRIYNFMDDNGNTLVWKTGNFLELNVGDKIKLKATVKEHSVYRDENQTVITRCTEVK